MSSAQSDFVYVHKIFNVVEKQIPTIHKTFDIFFTISSFSKSFNIFVFAMTIRVYNIKFFVATNKFVYHNIMGAGENVVIFFCECGSTFNIIFLPTWVFDECMGRKVIKTDFLI